MVGPPGAVYTKGESMKTDRVKKLVIGVAAVVVGGAMAVAISLTDSGELRQLAMKPATVNWFDVGLMHQSVTPYQIDAANTTTTYIRVSASATNEYVKRILTVGTVTSITFSYCNWTNRTTATYSPINGI